MNLLGLLLIATLSYGIVAVSLRLRAPSRIGGARETYDRVTISVERRRSLNVRSDQRLSV